MSDLLIIEFDTACAVYYGPDPHSERTNWLIQHRTEKIRDMRGSEWLNEHNKSLS